MSATRAKIIGAAASLIAEAGWAGATSRVIAARAGVRPGLIHYYFDSIDDLRRDAVVGRVRDFFGDRMNAASAHSDPATAIEALLRAVASRPHDDGDLRLLSESLVAAQRDERLRTDIATMLGDFRHALAKWLSERGVAQPLAAAVTITAAIDGFLLQTSLEPNLSCEPLVDALRLLVQPGRA